MKTPEEMAEAYAKLVAKDWMPNGTKELKNYFIGITIPNEDGSFSYCKNIFTGPDIRPAFVAGYEAAKNQLAGVSKVIQVQDNPSINTQSSDNNTQTNSSKISNSWISVKDRLPKIGDRILVTHRKGQDYANLHVMEASRFNDDEYCLPQDYSILADYVDYWMPLPKPPEKI